MSNAISTYLKRIVLITTSFVLALGLTTAAVPFLAAETASAAPNTSYALTAFDSLAWSADRRAPTGVESITSSTLTIGVDGSNPAPSADKKFEGIRASLPSGVTSISADLYVDPAWEGKTVIAGLWAQANNGIDNAWPTLEVIDNGSSAIVEVFNTFGGSIEGETEVSYGSTINLEIAVNPVTNSFNYFLNNNLIFTSASGNYKPLISILFNNYNTGSASNDYTTVWSNLRIGRQNTQTPTNISITKRSNNTAVSSGAVVNYTDLRIKWGADSDADRYVVRVTDPSGDVQSNRNTGTPYFDVDDAVRYGLFGTEQGTWSYDIKTKSATTGVWSEWSEPVTLIYDTTVPTVSLVSPTVALFNSATPLVLKAMDNIGLKQIDANVYKVGQGPSVVAASANAATVNGADEYLRTVDISSLTDGDYYIKFNTTDLAGHKTGTTVFSFTIDNTLPTVQIASPAAGQIVKGNTLTIKGSATDDSDFNYFYCYVTLPGSSEVGVRGADCNTTWHSVTNGTLGTVNISSLVDGDYEAHLVAYDKAGNHSDLNYAVPFTLDNTAPEGTVTYTGGIASDGVIYLKSINDLKFSATFTDAEALEHTSYAVWKADSNFDNRTLFCGNWNGAITSVAISGTVDSVNGDVKDCSPTGDWSNGSYVIMHIVYDEAGNTTYLNTYPGQKFVIDNQKPTSIVTQPVDGLVTSDNTLFIEGTATDPNFSFYRYYVWNDANQRVTPDVQKYVAVNGGVLGDAIDISGLSDGTYRLRLSTADMANNWVAAYATFTIDRTAPIVTVNTLSSIESGDPLRISGTVDGPVNLLRVMIDGGTPIDVPAENIIGTTWFLDVDTTNLTVGSHTVAVTATDAADNVSDSADAGANTTLAVLAPDTSSEDDLETQPLNNAIAPTPPAAQNLTPAGNAATDDLGEEDVQGAQTDKNENQLKNPAVLAGATGDGWNILGLMWYWWLLIIAAVGAAWWMIAAARRRSNES